jgi:hypothetical protein
MKKLFTIMMAGVSVVVAALFIFTANQPQMAMAFDDECDATVDGYDPLVMADPVGAIQTAVNDNDGGTVCLIGEFDFGLSSGVTVSDSVTILGEPGTKIMNMATAFLVDAPGLSKVTIEGIEFEGTIWDYIQVLQGDEVIIANNKFGYVNYESPYNGQNSIGILLGNWASTELYGDVIIKNNVIDLNPQQYDVEANEKKSFGIFGAVTETRSIDVIDNIVKNTSGRGILFTNSRRNTDTGTGIVRIERNNVDASPRGWDVFVPYENGHGSGIIAFNCFLEALYGLPYSGPGADIIVSHNTVKTQHQRSRSILVGTANDEEVASISVIGNHVIRDALPYTSPFFDYSDYGAITVMQSRVFVGQNIVEGTGHHAIVVASFESEVGGKIVSIAADENVLLGNNITKFNAETSDIALHNANNNVVVGNAGTVLDNGDNNKITGSKPVTVDGGVGPLF